MGERKIVVASTNAAKVEGVRLGLKEDAQRVGYRFAIHPVQVSSSVADVPLSDGEAIAGCRNRLAAAQSAFERGDIYVAVEGGFTDVGGTWFVRGWAIVLDARVGRCATASGASVPVPELITDGLAEPGRLHGAIDAWRKSHFAEGPELGSLGANGLFTGRVYRRQEMFRDAVRIGLAALSTDENWNV